MLFLCKLAHVWNRALHIVVAIVEILIIASNLHLYVSTCTRAQYMPRIQLRPGRDCHCNIMGCRGGRRCNSGIARYEGNRYNVGQNENVDGSNAAVCHFGLELRSRWLTRVFSSVGS